MINKHIIIIAVIDARRNIILPPTVFKIIYRTGTYMIVQHETRDIFSPFIGHSSITIQINSSS